MELTAELITAGLQRANENRRLGIRRDDLFTIQFVAFEFLGSRILVVDDQFDLLPGRHLHLGGNEAMILDYETHVRGCSGCKCGQKQDASEQDAVSFHV